jgi:hypothetical protein
VVRDTIRDLFLEFGIQPTGIGLTHIPGLRGTNVAPHMQPARLPDALSSPALKGLSSSPAPAPPAAEGEVFVWAAPAQPETLGRLAAWAQPAMPQQPAAPARKAVPDQAAGSLFPGVPGLDYTMCLLQCEYPGGQWVGSGVMVGKRTVLTVAHNLFNKFDGHNPTSIDRVTVLAGAHMGNGLSAPADYGDCWHPPQWVPFASDPDYRNDWRDPSPYDFGVINLPADTSWDQVKPILWGAVDDGPFPPEWFHNANVYLFGYPHGSTSPGYPSMGQAAPYQTDYLIYNMVAVAGMSGGPTFCYTPTGSGPWAFLLDVQSMTFTSTNPAHSLGVRITSRVVDAVRENARESIQ